MILSASVFQLRWCRRYSNPIQAPHSLGRSLCSDPLTHMSAQFVTRSRDVKRKRCHCAHHHLRKQSDLACITEILPRGRADWKGGSSVCDPRPSHSTLDQHTHGHLSLPRLRVCANCKHHSYSAAVNQKQCHCDVKTPATKQD
ncbi:hypothetical protein L1887_54808 [Cichorium endivia]|nr:hypothetical protein L1887_54808 [Cichorium endivia]